MRTTDGGENWINQSSETKYTLQSIYFARSKYWMDGWRVGNDT